MNFFTTRYTVRLCFLFSTLAAGPQEDKMLFAAVREGHFNEALKWIQNGADVNTIQKVKLGENTVDYIPLKIAVEKGNEAIARLLLEKGADPNLGRTAHLAAQFGYTNLVKLLAEYGADLSRQGRSKKTALHAAVKSRSLPTVETVLDIDFSCLNMQDAGKYTALHLAVLVDSFDIMFYLLDKGANPFLVNTREQTALDIAREMHAKRFDHPTLVEPIKHESKIRLLEVVTKAASGKKSGEPLE